MSEQKTETAGAGETGERVRALLAAAGLPASEAEIRRFAAAYPGYRAAADALYAVPEARYADPALRFRAEARITDWA
ncbi:hypothetical protein [Streptomyces hoynatensis]|uniref:Uncharacterized protein n=1 Tax=Streptomyces hoynatensis TaxID=1141874 RepID=A0A3A9YSS9_9ACTN|nr:hypothetical protein [Streptomyces hoynatensis]RKN39040.1 hypothetical protein D7294_22970 [Streptomyces hoynatensis]